jgi:hypothetical protein
MLIFTHSEGLLELRPGQEIELKEEVSYPYLELIQPPVKKRVTKKRTRKVDIEEEVSTDGKHSSPEDNDVR